MAASLAGVPTYPAFATTLQVVLDSSALAGTNAQLAFDFTNGGGLASNTATITAFSTNGSLGAASFTGDVTGTLPGIVTLTNTAFFNELLQSITLANTLSFSLTLTENRSGTSLPDQFSFFLLDASGVSSLFTTSDPTVGANALFAVDITGTATGDVQVYTATTSPAASWNVTTTAIPTPPAFILFSLGLFCLAAYRRVQVTTHY